MAPNTNATTPPMESLFADEAAGRLLLVGPAEPVVCAPEPDPVPVGLLPDPVPFPEAEPEGLDPLPEVDFVAADPDADDDAEALVELATDEEPDTLTTAEPPLIEPAVPDMSL